MAVGWRIASNKPPSTRGNAMLKRPLTDREKSILFKKADALLESGMDDLVSGVLLSQVVHREDCRDEDCREVVFKAKILASLCVNMDCEFDDAVANEMRQCIKEVRDHEKAQQDRDQQVAESAKRLFKMLASGQEQADGQPAEQPVEQPVEQASCASAQ